jgi:hypothetical protein
MGPAMPEPKRREIYLDGHVAIECPLLMSDDELAVILEAFVKTIHERSGRHPPSIEQLPEKSKKSRSGNREQR